MFVGLIQTVLLALLVSWGCPTHWEYFTRPPNWIPSFLEVYK